jgi:hypothetical protein
MIRCNCYNLLAASETETMYHENFLAASAQLGISIEADAGGLHWHSSIRLICVLKEVNMPTYDGEYVRFWNVFS